MIATRLEALAKETKVAARDARARAIEAGRRAVAARKLADQLNPSVDAKDVKLGRIPGSILRGAEERESRKLLESEGLVPSKPQPAAQDGSGDRADPGLQPRPRIKGDENPEPATAPSIPIEKDKHAAAKRTADENKAMYFGRKRAQHDAGPPKELRRETFTFPPGQAPDMADLELRTEWQWAINVARGDGSFQGKEAAKHSKTGNVDLARLLIGPAPKAPNPDSMKWGMRRYNLGDSTVVDCDFEDITKEHGIYDSLAGHGLYRGNTFHHLGGQAIQIAYRDQAYSQYAADNLPFTGKPILILEDNHAADCGLHPSRSGFTWTFFDYGTHEHPSTVILRNCTSVHAWDFIRTPSSQTRVPKSHPQAIRAPGGLVMHQYQHAKEEAAGEQSSYAVEHFVIDNCLFDHTQNSNPIAAIRGVETILIEDSCFISRDGRGAFVDVDDIEGRPSGRIIIENCVSPSNAEVFLRVRKRNVMSMNCPGQRIEIDLNTMKRTVSEPIDDEITQLRSPLRNRVPAPGITGQPADAVMDLVAEQARLESQRDSDEGPR